MTDLHAPSSAPAPQGPVMAKLLGYAGALPFGGCALAGVLDIQLAGLQTASLLLGYGAIILSFLGGLQWGRRHGILREQLARAHAVRRRPVL